MTASPATCDTKVLPFLSNPASTIDILDQLKIDGYDIKLPESWQAHSQARILVYIKQGLKVKWKKLDVNDRDLPSISCEIGTGKERNTSVNFFYKEWKSGVSGLDDKAAQLDRLTRQINHWKTLFSGGSNVVIMGDANTCFSNGMLNHTPTRNYLMLFKPFSLNFLHFSKSISSQGRKCLGMEFPVVV